MWECFSYKKGQCSSCTALAVYGIWFSAKNNLIRPIQSNVDWQASALCQLQYSVMGMAANRFCLQLSKYNDRQESSQFAPLFSRPIQAARICTLHAARRRFLNFQLWLYLPTKIIYQIEHNPKIYDLVVEQGTPFIFSFEAKRKRKLFHFKACAASGIVCPTAACAALMCLPYTSLCCL